MVERRKRSNHTVPAGVRAAVVAMLVAALFAACSTDAPTGPGGVPLQPPASSSITVTAGESQTASAGETTPTQPSLRIANASGAGVSGITVQFTVVSGGGTVEHPTVVTDASGTASPGRWTLGTVAGTQELRATASGVGSVSFFATATPNAPNTLAILRGDQQSAVVGTPVAVAPAAIVRDAHGNPVPGVAVSFSVTAGGGSITGATATSDANGEAAVGSWTLGPGTGTNRLRATASGLGEVTFEATAVDAGSVTLTLVAGDGQTAAVGTAVPTVPRVRLVDAQGQPIAGASVEFAIDAGGGSVTGGTQTTDAAGEAAVGAWTLGTAPGTNRLTAAIDNGAPPVVFTATATAGPPASVSAVAGTGQTASVGAAVAVAPRVRVVDAFGNPVASQSVTFAVATGGGSASGGSQSTAANGEASVGAWNLGPTAGANTLTATVAGTGIAGNPVTFSATATVTPAQVAATAGQGQTATVATSLPTDPEVRVTDGVGNPVAGVSVTFAVTGGGGSLTGATGTTDADGRVSVGSWTLGSTAGSNTMTATVAGSGIAGNPITFTATGTAGPAAQIAITAGDGQSATVGTAVGTDPQVRVTDAHGNGVSGVGVTFAVLTGGGSVSGGSQTTGSSGYASVGSWTLGASAGSNTLSATASGGGISGNPVTFGATGTAPGGSGYDIEIRYNPGSTPTGAQSSAFNAAVSQWESVITGDLTDTAVNRPPGTCTSSTAINETIDDLVIFVTLEAIDGPGGTLGSAGPCLIRSGSSLSVAGQMRFDTADLANLESAGLLDDVIMHEMGHVIGLGTLWSTKGLLTGAGTSDPYFTGALAKSAFNSVGGSSYVGNKVPVENTGGPGTADGHWRESVFGSELMTGWVNPGSNPMSAVTVQSLADMGYTVNGSAADAYSLSIIPLTRGGRTPGRLEIIDDIWRVDIEIITRDGRRVGLIPR